MWYDILGFIVLVLIVLGIAARLGNGAPLYHDWKWYLRLVAKRSILVRWTFPRLVTWNENGIDILAHRKHWKDAKKTQPLFKGKYPVVREGALFIAGVFELQRLTDAAFGRQTPKDPRVDLVVGNDLLMLDILCGYNPSRKPMYVPNTPAAIRDFLKAPIAGIDISARWNTVRSEYGAWVYVWGDVRGPALRKFVAEEKKRKRRQ